MALLDVNALVALGWDSHVHHVRMRHWFAEHASAGWATCPVTESGFVRISSNPTALPMAIGVDAARAVLSSLRQRGTHRFVVDDVSPIDDDVPIVNGYRQVTDAHLLTLARRNAMRLVTFDRALATLADGDDVEVLSAL